MSDNPYMGLVPKGDARLPVGADNPYASLVPKAPAKPEASTTFGGVAGAVTRGLAPIAVGAGVGAAAGAPFAGVGAVPGAIAGAAATGLTELTGAVYNPVARHFGLREMPTPSELTGKALDAFGVKRPSTTTEHLVETAASMAPFGMSAPASLGRAVTENRADAVEKFIEHAYESAIRPTVVGKRTATQISQADQNAASGISSIVANKANLVLADAKGREVVGRLPQSLDEFVQAIEQTKRPIFAQYDTLARQAEGLGAKIETAPIAAELRKFVADPSFNLPKYEGMREYAKHTADVLEAQRELPPTIAQGMVKNLNEGLSTFYRASSPEAASKAAVDDLVANQLRGRLDTVLEQAGLPGYAETRRAYGALKSIEGEVAHRAIVYGRRDPAGGVLGRLGNIASYEELARFAVTMDPAALASAAALRGGRVMLERYHGPNRAVRRMFEKAEELQRTRGPLAPPPPETGGLQPGRPSGPGQKIYGGAQTPEQSLMGRGGGNAAQTFGMNPRGAMPIESDPFLTPPGGGRVE